MVKCLLVILGVLSAPATSLAQTTLFGGVGAEWPETGAEEKKIQILAIDQANGTGTLVGESATEDSVDVVGLAIDSAGRLFAATTESVGQPNAVTLIRIDPLTGQRVAVIGTLAPQVTGLAIQPGTDVLFGLAFNFSTWTSDLYIIDKTTALATFVGNTGLTGWAVAFGPDGTLYLTSSEDWVTWSLHTLDPTTAAVLTTSAMVTDVWPLALAVRPTDGVVFMSSGAGDIYTLSTEGFETFVGNTGFPRTGGVAFTPVPANKTQCRDGGWRTRFPFAFKNQGDCMQFVNTGK